MKKHIYRDDEIDKINLDESFIKSFRWLDDEEGHPVNLEVEIDWNGQKDLVEDFDFMSIKSRSVGGDRNFKFRPIHYSTPLLPVPEVTGHIFE